VQPSGFSGEVEYVLSFPSSLYLLKQQNLRLISDCEHYQNCYKKQYEDNKTTIQLLEQQKRL